MNQTLWLFGLSSTPLELISFVLSIITVWLNIRQKHWAWLFAILSSAMYALVFFESRLYGDTGLQLVFIAVSIWGWYQWLHGRSGHRTLTVSRLRPLGWCVSGFALLVGFVVISLFLKRFTDTDVPYADGFLTAGSLLGQYLLSKKRLENWHVWIAVDIFYVALYAYKDLMLTAGLYALFVAMATIGLRTWKKSYGQQIWRAA